MAEDKKKTFFEKDIEQRVIAGLKEETYWIASQTIVKGP